MSSSARRSVTTAARGPDGRWALSLLLVGMIGLAFGSALAGEPPVGGAPVSPTAGTAGPPDTQTCLAAYTEAQKLRRAGKLQTAREKLLICSQVQCPTVAKADCVPWLDEVERSLPSIVVVAKGKDGRDTAEVRVLVDGRVVVDRLDGRPVVVDPGTHTLRFEHGGVKPIERRLVVQVGVKNRQVVVSFAPAPPIKPTASPPGGPERPPPERAEPIAGYVLTGVGVLALGSFAVFGLIGRSEIDEYDETCAPTKTCDSDDVSATKTKLVVADVSLVVGIAAVGVGVGLILYNKLSDPDPSPTARIDLRPVPGGATGALSVTF